MMSSTENSNFDIDFSIPNLSETPTLEEILKKQDDDFELVDQLIKQDLNLKSISDLESTLNVPIRSDFHNESSFNITELNFIKSQLALSKSDKIDSGKPTALTISKNLINIGTFNGHILVFGFDEKLAAFLKHEKEFGSISSLSINKSETKLLCGGSKGSISLWNLTNYEIIRQVNDFHAPFSSILFIQYLSNHNFAIINDTSGSVFLLDIRKKNFDSQCIFSGSRGETLTIKPLSEEEIPNAAIFNGIQNICLLAMATVSKIIVISLRPYMVVHFTFTLKANLNFLPLICWNLLYEYNNEKLPLLTFGRQDQLYINKMTTDFVEKIDFVPLFQFTTTNYCLQYICWLEPEKLFIMDNAENGHLIDVVAQEELETIDLSHMELIYENAHYKSLANGGYVSRAMAQAGEHACNNSFSLRMTLDKNRLYMLGLKSVFMVTLRDWEEKVDYLLEQNDHLKALRLLHDNYLLYKERRPHSTNSTDINRIISRIDVSLSNFVNHILNFGFLNCKNEDDIRETITIYLKYSICLQNKHEKIFELFEKTCENSLIKYSLIECLEHYIFDDEFPNLNPVIVKEMIDYYSKKEWFNLLDSMITHFEITSLDIDYIIRIYPRYNLYDSFIYIYNCALEDFIFPFDSLLKLLQNSIQSNSQFFSKNDILIGNKLLVYLNCMLTCLYYPNKGKIIQDKQQEHLEKCFKRLTKKNIDNRLDILDVLFRYDCIEFLNIIIIAFDFLDKNHFELLHWKQIIIDRMIEFLIDDNNPCFKDEHKNSFFIFLGRCFSSDFNSLKIKDAHFEKMVDSLFDMKNKRFEERQQILIQMFKNDHLKLRIDSEKFLHRAQQNQMYKICELIYQNNQDWINLLKVYMNDSSKHEEIFNFIDFTIKNEDFFKKEGNKSDFLNCLFENFCFLVELDCLKSSQLFYSFIEHCDNLFKVVIDKLDPHQLYRFLKETILQNRIEYQNNSILTTQQASSKYKIIELCLDPKNQENFIELACQFDKKNIVTILESLQEYDNMNALNICHQYKIRDGEAFLLEKMKHYQKSFDILFKDFKQTIDDLLIEKDFQNVSAFDNDKNFEMISMNFHKLLNFCDRISKASYDNASQDPNFWLYLLEYLIKIKMDIKNLNNSPSNQYSHVVYDEKSRKRFQDFLTELSRYLNTFFENLINEMLTHLNLILFLEIIMDKILKQKDSMCDFREMLLCILENYNYEKTLLELTTNILSEEHHQLVQDFRSLKTKSKIVKRLKCNLCLLSKTMTKNAEKFVSYNCYHLFHWECIEIMKREKSLKNILCPICHKLVDEIRNIENQANNNLDDDSMKGENMKHTDKQPRIMFFNEIQLRILNQFHNGRLKKIQKTY